MLVRMRRARSPNLNAFVKPFQRSVLHLRHRTRDLRRTSGPGLRPRFCLVRLGLTPRTRGALSRGLPSAGRQV
jgi:hypothetical protein